MTPKASGGHSFETFGDMGTGFVKALDDKRMGRSFIDFCTNFCVLVHTWKHRSIHSVFHTWARRASIKCHWIGKGKSRYALTFV